jgi:signal peptidase
MLAVLGGLLVWSLLPCLLGWKPQVVLTGSMSPRIHPGDLVLAAPVVAGSVRPGQVVLFRDPVHPGRTVVHRLVRFDGDGNLITRGDANAVEDSTPVSPGAVLGLPRLRVPYIGRPVVWARAHQFSPLLAVALVLMAASALVARWPERR